MTTNYPTSQTKLMLIILEHIVMENPNIKLPWDKIAESAGYSNAKSAQTIWGAIKARMKAEANGEVVTTPKKRKKTGEDNGVDGGAKGRAKKVKVKDEVEDEADVGGAVGTDEGPAV